MTLLFNIIGRPKLIKMICIKQNEIVHQQLKYKGILISQIRRLKMYLVINNKYSCIF